MKQQKSIKEHLRYHFDLWLSKGTVSMVILLFVVTGIIIFILSLLAFISCETTTTTLSGTLWNTLNHTFDPGVLSGDNGNHLFLFFMLLATLCGMFFTALLIGFINDGISGRVQDLAKGIEPVIEKNHIVLLGFNESTFIIIGELIEAYENQHKNRNAIVVMDTVDKQEMESRIRTQYSNTGNISVVCRRGSIYNRADLNRCSISTSKSIIIAQENDFDTIKSILACTEILNSCNNSQTFITTVINRKENEFAARIAGNDINANTDAVTFESNRLDLLLMERTVSRIMTHTCRQQGFSRVFTEIFNFEGVEFYVVHNEGINERFFREMDGKTIREINRCLPDTIIVGIIDAQGNVIIKDPNQVILHSDCSLIVLEEDDNRILTDDEHDIHYSPPVSTYEDTPVTILIMECNPKLPMILNELCNYLSPGSWIYLAADPNELEKFIADPLVWHMLGHKIDSAIKDINTTDDSSSEHTPEFNINPEINVINGFSDTELIQGDCQIYNYNTLEKLLNECHPDYVLTLSNPTNDDKEADEKSLTLLLYCRYYKLMHPEANFGITCEMRSVVNQNLAQNTMANDFIISRHIASLMMAQIAENRELKGVFEILLSSEGFEIYMKPAKYYINIQNGMKIDLFSIVDAVAEKHEIFIGYCLQDVDNKAPILNPIKREQYNPPITVTLYDTDQFIVLAEDPQVR